MFQPSIGSHRCSCIVISGLTCETEERLEFERVLLLPSGLGAWKALKYSGPCEKGNVTSGPTTYV